MPLNRGNFITGGKQGILLFEATYAGIEEDIPNDFSEGKLRARLDFHDVEILDAEEAFNLDDDTLNFYVGQSQKDNSANARLIKEWDTYAQKAGIDGVSPDVFEGMRLIWGRVRIEYGKDTNPSTIWVPVGKPGDDIEKLKKKGTKAKKSGGGDDLEVLFSAIVSAAEASVTTEDIKKLISAGGADMRKLVSKGGGQAKVLETLVAAKRLELEDGVYSVA